MRISIYYFLGFITCALLWLSACGDNMMTDKGTFQLTSARVGIESILSDSEVEKSKEIVLVFSTSLNSATIAANLSLLENNVEIAIVFITADMDKLVTITSEIEFSEGNEYRLMIGNGLIATDESTFPGVNLTFSIGKDKLQVLSLTHQNKILDPIQNNVNISTTPEFELELSEAVEASELEKEMFFVGNANYAVSVEEVGSKKYKITLDSELPSLEKFNLLFKATLGASIQRDFDIISYKLYTDVSNTPVFPILDDEALLTLVQEQTFKYFWDFGHPISGMARERNASGDVVTSGGSGFGLMSMIVAVERGFITRDEAVSRWVKMTNFLESADRFHGAWSHWINGATGTVIPFSNNDNGGDLVETAFLIQGLLSVRQYLNESISEESALIEKITQLWESVEWSWYQQNGQDQLYWHWSPNFGWQKNLKISGHNETQIVYTLAAASPTFGIEKQVYTNGYARNGQIINGNTFYGYELPVGFNNGGPLFFSHYSYLGMDPRNLSDEYANYWTQNVNHSLINRQHCIDNPNNYVGYSDACWGLTASDNDEGYSAHSPNNDKGVITPTAAISSIPYTPEESLAAIRHFYFYLGDKLWGEYGFYDAFNPTAGWTASSYLAIDQGPIICMIENYRTQLLWDLYMSAPEVQAGLDKLGFTY